VGDFRKHVEVSDYDKKKKVRGVISYCIVLYIKAKFYERKLITLQYELIIIIFFRVPKYFEIN
jgi:hypothetical protein